jgi:hypothetical protein
LGIPVVLSLGKALQHRGISQAKIPDNIEDTIQGYVLAVSWVIRTVAPAVGFGWSVDLWDHVFISYIYEPGEGTHSPVGNQFRPLSQRLGSCFVEVLLDTIYRLPPMHPPLEKAAPPLNKHDRTSSRIT